MTKPTACTDPDTGTLLHAYEIRILSGVEMERFELHLMYCEHCMHEAHRLRQEMAALRTDQSVRQLTNTAVQGTTTRLSPLTRMRNALSFKRPVLAYLLALLLAYPAYLGLFSGGPNGVRSVRTIDLLPSRTPTTSTFKIAQNENYVMAFMYHGAVVGREYRIVLCADNGSVVWTIDKFNDFDANEIGRALVPAELMKSGRYSLSVTDLSLNEDSPRRVQTYEFRLVE